MHNYVPPQSPPVHSCIFFIVGPSSCGMWDAALAWPDEQCDVCAQDLNQRNPGPPAVERVNLTTRPWGQPPKIKSLKKKNDLPKVHTLIFTSQRHREDCFSKKDFGFLRPIIYKPFKAYKGGFGIGKRNLSACGASFLVLQRFVR